MKGLEQSWALVIAGAGGFGRTVLQFALDAGVRVAGFVDDSGEALRGFEVGVNILGSAESLQPMPEWRFLVALGHPPARKAMSERFAPLAIPAITLVHPLAYVAPSARLGPGCIVGPFAFVGPNAVLGAHVAVNAHGFVDHDVKVGCWSYIGPRGTVSGAAELGECVSVGAGATVTYRQRIATGTRIPPGVVVGA